MTDWVTVSISIPCLLLGSTKRGFNMALQWCWWVTVTFGVVDGGGDRYKIAIPSTPSKFYPFGPYTKLHFSLLYYMFFFLLIFILVFWVTDPVWILNWMQPWFLVNLFYHTFRVFCSWVGSFGQITSYVAFLCGLDLGIKFE